MLGLAVSFIIVGDIGRKGDGIVPGWPVQWGRARWRVRLAVRSGWWVRSGWRASVCPSMVRLADGSLGGRSVTQGWLWVGMDGYGRWIWTCSAVRMLIRIIRACAAAAHYDGIGNALRRFRPSGSPGARRMAMPQSKGPVMTLLQHELTDFKVNAFQNNEFHEVTKEDGACQVICVWGVFYK